MSANGKEQYRLNLTHRAVNETRCLVCGWKAQLPKKDAQGFWHSMTVHTRQHCHLG